MKGYIKRAVSRARFNKILASGGATLYGGFAITNMDRFARGVAYYVKGAAVIILCVLAVAVNARAQGGATGGNPPTEIRRAGSKASIDSGGNAYFDLMTG